MTRHQTIKRQFIKRRAPREQIHASTLLAWGRAQRPIGTHTQSPGDLSKIGHESGENEKRELF